MANDQGYGYVQPNDHLGNYNPMAAIVAQMLGRVRTSTMCKVVGLGTLPGTVNVQPLVSIVDGMGNATPHGTIYNVPYLQMQAGTSAVVLVPVAGDVGAMLVCDRDISSVKATLAAAPPPSMRTFDLADAIYLGVVLGPTPTNTITATAGGFIVSGNLIIEGNLQLAGTIEAAAGGPYAGNIATTGDVTAGTVSLKTHIHSGVTTGGGDSGPPVP